eukprot:g10246.t1
MCVPEFDARLLSSCFPSIIIIRKRAQPGATNTDEWMAVQVKVAGPLARRTLGGVKRNGSSNRISLDLHPLDPASIAGTLQSWYTDAPFRNLASWMEVFGAASSRHRQHEMAGASVAQLLYDPLDLHVERVCSVNTCVDGNLVLSGVRCLQRISRTVTTRRYCAHVFDVNKGSFGGVTCRGRGWEGKVQRYICVVVTPTGEEGDAFAVDGVFIFPPEYVFRDETGEAKSRRGRLLVYPPFTRTRNARSRARQEEQQEFFVDFSDHLLMGERLEKTKKLLGL